MLFFPSYASYDPQADEWAVDLHAWAYRVVDDSAKRHKLARLLRHALGLDAEHAGTSAYQRRSALFLVNVMRDHEVRVRLGGQTLSLGKTRKSGHAAATLSLPGPLIREHAGDHGSIRLEPDHAEAALGIDVQLIPPTGVSVISDIDDTTKASYVWKKRKLIKTTFTRIWKPTKGLPETYRAWAETGAVFHYVSTTPWQLYPSLAQFKQRVGYPAGTFHLKRFRWKDRSFFDLFAKAGKYKPRLITPILDRFPDRRFVLVGDNAEHDPAIYADLARARPNQIAAIRIRDVRDTGEDHKRWVEVFEGLPDDLWQVFGKVKHLRTPPELQPKQAPEPIDDEPTPIDGREGAAA